MPQVMLREIIRIVRAISYVEKLICGLDELLDGSYTLQTAYL